MPELPDLEVFKTNIYNRLMSKRLVDLAVYHPDKVITPQETLLNDLAGQTLLRIDRVGKELYFDFGEQKVLVAHLMLHGKIAIIAEAEVKAVKFKIIALRFERETLVFSDMDGRCNVKYNPQPAKAPDALDAAFTPEYFLDLARKRPRVNVKAFLIDQKVVKGIGNAYADEILWAARVSPYSQVGAIPKDRLMVLYQAIGEVLLDAVASIRRIAPDIISGEERSFLKVHNSKLKVTQTGYPITVATVASKITYYTEEQVVYM